MNTMASARSSAGIARWASLGGILYVVLFVIGVIVTFGGAIYATLAFAAIAINVGIRTMSDDTYHHTVYPGLIHAADDASYVLHATGGAGASAMIIAATLAAMRATAIPKWAGWLGIIAGILALASIIFFPQAAIALWILIVSGLLFARGGQSRPAVAG